jgi:hypothetical protein
MKKILIALIVILIGIQFIPIEKSNPPVTLDIDAPEKIESILRTSCYDCHSNETVWPWYSHIVPVSLIIAGDVNDGRKHLNFSEWDKYGSDKIEKILEEIGEEIEEKKMPLPMYTFIHPHAKLEDYQVKLMIEWVKSGNVSSERLRYD